MENVLTFHCSEGGMVQRIFGQFLIAVVLNL